MDDIDLLLNYLNTIFPISEEFRKDLRHILKLRTIKKNTVLIKINKKAKKAWWLITGYVSASTADKSGMKTIVRIYGPNQIFTAFYSFFEDILTIHKIKAITDIKVLEIKKQDFLDFQEKYPEAMLLANRIILQNTRSETERSNLIHLPKDEKVAAFDQHYPIQGIPNKVSASFLQMQELDYVEQKVILQKANDSMNQFLGVPVNHTYKNRTEMAYSIKLHLVENYDQAGVDHISQIAQLFNTTRKTVTRNFSHVFNTTVYKFVLDLRMEQAKILLLNKDLTITGIAAQLGYPSIFAFSRAFKTHFGYSPNSSRH